MENKQAMALAVGVGALGTALVYLGYSAYHKNNDLENIEELDNKSVLQKIWDNSPESGKTVKKDKNLVVEAAKKKNSAWGKFWKNEHEELNNEE
jgi:hypothetical protein